MTEPVRYILTSGETGTAGELFLFLKGQEKVPVTRKTFVARLRYGWLDKERLLMPMLDKKTCSRLGGKANKQIYQLSDGFRGTAGECYEHLQQVGRQWSLPSRKTIAHRLWRGVLDVDQLLTVHWERKLPPKNVRANPPKVVVVPKSLVRCRHPLPEFRDWKGWNKFYVRPGSLYGYDGLRKALENS